MKIYTRRSEKWIEEKKMWETISEIGGANENLVCAQEEFRLPSRSCDHAIAILENKMKAYTEATAKHMRVARAQAQMSQT